LSCVTNEIQRGEYELAPNLDKAEKPAGSLVA
jgi:hypothetical protein